MHIQDYSDFLQEKKLTASTIHTYLAGVCFVWDVPLDAIVKPLRHTSEFVRSRGKGGVLPDCSSRLGEIAKVVGCRRKDYVRLWGTDLRCDESGYLCVFIRRGKGGKQQLQRILPGDEELVRNYFNGTNDFVFTKKELREVSDLHHLRALQAKRAYEYYCHRLETEPRYDEQLKSEIERRWRTYNKKKWDPACVEGTYYIRGLNRKFAKEHGLALEYNRLALMAVSVFHLSHWRTNVAVANYLLAL